MLTVVPILVCYLLGAIPVGLIVARAAGITDIRKRGSGNIGATNVWRAAGFRVAIWVFVGDISKGVIAVIIGRMFWGAYPIEPLSLEAFLVICGVAAVLGQTFPVYLGFKGGKGVNTALGVVLTLLTLEALIAVAAFIAVVLTTRYISLGSIVGSLALFVAVMVEKFAMGINVASVYLGLTGLLAALVLVTHRQNIGRLLSGNENRFSLAARSADTGGSDG